MAREYPGACGISGPSISSMPRPSSETCLPSFCKSHHIIESGLCLGEGRAEIRVLRTKVNIRLFSAAQSTPVRICPFTMAKAVSISLSEDDSSSAFTASAWISQTALRSEKFHSPAGGSIRTPSVGKPACMARRRALGDGLAGSATCPNSKLTMLPIMRLLPQQGSPRTAEKISLIFVSSGSSRTFVTSRTTPFLAPASRENRNPHYECHDEGFASAFWLTREQRKHRPSAPSVEPCHQAFHHRRPAKCHGCRRRRHLPFRCQTSHVAAGLGPARPWAIVA